MAISTETPVRGGKRPTPAGCVKVFKTAVFKLHNPSKRKRAMLHDSMKRAHLAYERLLNRFMPNETEIARLNKLPKKELREALKPLEIQIYNASRYPHLSGNAKDAILGDCLDQINSTIALQDEQEEVGLPTVTRISNSQPDFAKALDDIASSTTLSDENEAKAELDKVLKMGVIRPLNFVRTDPGKGFMLFRHPETGGLWAWLNLHSVTSRFAKAKKVKPDHLVYLKTGNRLTGSSKTGELFPLEFGHEFHDYEFIKKGEPQRARLYHRLEKNGQPRDDFELHVTFKFETPKIEATTWLGIDRGIYKIAAYAVLDGTGRLLKTGYVDGEHLRDVQRKLEKRTADRQKRGRTVKEHTRRAEADEAVHVTSNEIVAVARQQKCQTIIENLKNLGATRTKKRIPGQRRGGFNVLLGRSQYEKLRRQLTYKLQLAGLPIPIKVNAAGTSITCPRCGLWNNKNRVKVPKHDKFEMDKFRCIDCNYKADADENAAHVIAIKGMWLKQLPPKALRNSKKLVDKYRFENYIKESAERRMGA